MVKIAVDPDQRVDASAICTLLHKHTKLTDTCQTIYNASCYFCVLMHVSNIIKTYKGKHSHAPITSRSNYRVGRINKLRYRNGVKRGFHPYATPARLQSPRLVPGTAVNR